MARIYKIIIDIISYIINNIITNNESNKMKSKIETITTENSFGKEIKVNKEQWINKWKDSTVASLGWLLPIEEYNNLKNRITELASKDFDDKLVIEKKEKVQLDNMSDDPVHKQLFGI